MSFAKKLIILLVFLIMFSLSFYKSYQLQLVYSKTCDLISEKIYLQTDHSKNWKIFCKTRSEKFKFRFFIKPLINEIQETLNFLAVSHLNIYTPSENKKSWSGLSNENGLIIHNMNNQYFIVDTSPHFKTNRQLMFGDQILSVNGSNLIDLNKIKYSFGTFSIKRIDEVFKVEIKKKETKMDSSPQLQELDSKKAHLKILSFRPEYFDKSEWINLSSKLKKYKKIIIDLRRNPGGNFVSMLRALSPFTCKPTPIGYIGVELSSKNIKNLKQKALNLADDLNSQKQYYLISQGPLTQLTTFSGYGCFEGQIEVIVDHNTGSVAEIFAHSLQKMKKAIVKGQQSSGQVLLAVWYDLPGWENGYSISIPESNFFDLDFYSLEGIGVTPDIEISYDLESFKKAKDPFIFGSFQ